MSKSKHQKPVDSKHQKIVDYWAPKVPEVHMGCDWDMALGHCWRCGRKTPRLEMCHIIAKQFLGDKKDVFEPSNLVLLCRECHDEAPDHNSPDYMWLWIKNTSKGSYDMFNFRKALEQYKILFNKDLLEEVNTNTIDPGEFMDVYKEHIAKDIGFHSGGASPSTIAIGLHKTLEKIRDLKIRKNS